MLRLSPCLPALMQAVVVCLIKSVSSVGYVMIITLIIILIFAILGMVFFLGQFYYCTNDTCCSNPFDNGSCQVGTRYSNCLGLLGLVSARSLVCGGGVEGMWLHNA
jgi:hypothetical protein